MREKHFLGIVKGVSRSFYLSVRLLPAATRLPVAVAYGLARAADTICDLDVLAAPDRRQALLDLRALVDGRGGERFIEDLGALLPRAPSRERALLARLGEFARAHRELPDAHRFPGREVLYTLTDGMLFDLERFDPAAGLGALETLEELDRYTYLIAGCVGRYWTTLHAGRLRGNVETAHAAGVRLGKGLQLVNVLRDLARDLRIGRCYLPVDSLQRLGLEPSALLDPAVVSRVRPLTAGLVELARAHLRAGIAYADHYSPCDWRMRLGATLPLAIGLRTLRMIERGNPLDPARTIKVPRRQVYALLLAAPALGALARRWAGR